MPSIFSISSINYICIRIPNILFANNIDIIKNYIISTNFSKNILVISPPGLGKTTLLRSLALFLSSAPIYKRVSLIDSKNELYISDYFKYSMCDVFSGYTKKDGILFATTYFSPQYIICDEITDIKDTSSILLTSNSGVPLICSAHATSFDDLYNKPIMNSLLSNKIFNTLLIIRQNNDNYSYFLQEI